MQSLHSLMVLIGFMIRALNLSTTPSLPAPDGGGKLSRDTFNIVQPDQGAICSNAPRTFLNEDTCFMTENPTACVAELFDPYDYSNLPKFYVNVNATTIRNIYSATGGGAEGTRYLYAVQGLRQKDDKAVGFPCERTGSRWLPITCTGAAASLDPTVQEIFSNLLADDSDPNPLMRDIWNWWDVECPAPVYQSYGFEVRDLDGTKCWKNVHPEYLNVYDMTFWTRLDGHPVVWLYSSALNFTNTKGVLVCGSPFEVANDLMLGGSQGRGAYDAMNPYYATTDYVDFAKQKRIVWTQIALGAKDQLRQRVAWALAQILVVAPTAVSDAELMTDAMTTYYDIFVRNAFGNYRSILKEVSYSPLMAQMLTYYGSRSTAYTWRNNRELEFADENYAREIMQLFTIGMHKLNKDGTKVLESSGNPVRAYTNDDIVEYARVWTGFIARSLRGNIENIYDTNNVDPMRINLEYRDVFPKMGLDRKYIGDGVPLCSDLPANTFEEGRYLQASGKITISLVAVRPGGVVDRQAREASEVAAQRGHQPFLQTLRHFERFYLHEQAPHRPRR
ncbi:Protein of unknown function (DUF1501) [Fragilaria crotonensis]|nr:Protein of unknown function (DUF1501) [Fragilaria crotonensis]